MVQLSHLYMTTGKTIALTIQASMIVQLIKNPPAMQEILVQFLGWEDLLEKG